MLGIGGSFRQGLVPGLRVAGAWSEVLCLFRLGYTQAHSFLISWLVEDFLWEPHYFVFNKTRYLQLYYVLE